MNEGKTRSSLSAYIIRNLDEMRPSEQKVGEIVISEPEKVMRMSIAALSDKAGVSEPTVLRFCRQLGLGGFTDLKLALATDVATGMPFVDADVSMIDTPQIVGDKMLGTAMKQLNLVKSQLNYDQVVAAAEVIGSARRIDICGIAQSNFVAAEVQHRLARMGYCAIAMADPHMQLQAAASMEAGDAALIMSFAGQSKETVDVARLARRVGAKVIVISRSTSALAQEADILINVDSDEQTFLYSSSSTRIAHLMVIDILTTILAINVGEPMIERLRRSRLATNEYWIPTNE
ncbi:MurR/RpiR family transcriptional regulator [Cucumibacter marinus]|uniref:MurR/RpiR family transcriptional regulator n=1 Tax=Cucumibacter marinus TaxID=1121252 RepID=UPI00048F5264|nr:MurR/RpiR family transcriptional regulator [Cucumibacter marinus]